MVPEDVVVIFYDGFVFLGFKKNVVIQFVLGFFFVVAVMVRVIFLPVDQLESGMLVDKVAKSIISQNRTDPN